MNYAGVGGFFRKVQACHQVTCPRISPAVIVLVRNDNSALLVHGKNAPPGRFSLVAGFVEQGETMVKITGVYAVKPGPEPGKKIL
jgi:NADH pyrophosphatase NudC (nudix superfamily)